jgi:hypothetical protein
LAKPSDFLISIIDFLGILLPGAVLVFLHGSYFLLVFNIQTVTDGQTSHWILFFVCSYIIGHFLLGIGVPLNKLQRFRSAEANDKYYQEVKSEISLPPDVKKNREDSYYRAFSFVRLYNAAAVAEVDRQAAEYKLFRSLTLVFMLDLPLAWIRDMQNGSRAVFVCLLAALALIRFLFLLDWARRLTFEFYHLMTKGPRPIASE